MADEKQQLKIGQIWRRKRDGKLVWISAMRAYGSEHDVYWRAVEGRNKGAIWGTAFREKYELVEEAP